MHIKFIARGESNEFPVQTTASNDDDDGQQHVKERQQRKTENFLECRAANATKKAVKMKPNKIITKKGRKKEKENAKSLPDDVRQRRQCRRRQTTIDKLLACELF